MNSIAVCRALWGDFYYNPKDKLVTKKVILFLFYSILFYSILFYSILFFLVIHICVLLAWSLLERQPNPCSLPWCSKAFGYNLSHIHCIGYINCKKVEQNPYHKYITQGPSTNMYNWNIM